MVINLYTNNSKDNEREKDLTRIIEMNGNFRDKSSIIDPVFMFETESIPANANYMYIPNFARYYFITDITAVRKNLYEVHAHVDVLSSAGSGLDNCSGIVRRQENTWNLYLDDGVLKAYSNPNIIQKAFPSGFDLSNATYILAVAGS